MWWRYKCGEPFLYGTMSEFPPEDYRVFRICLANDIPPEEKSEHTEAEYEAAKSGVLGALQKI